MLNMARRQASSSECSRRTFGLVSMWFLNACARFTLPVPVNLKRFLALELVFILGIDVKILAKIRIIFLSVYYFFAFGAKNAIMRRPSSFGICSSTPISCKRSANLSNINSPRSWNKMPLPLNCT